MQLDPDGAFLRGLSRVAVAVSGGGDSMALLHLAHGADVPVYALTVDHQLRDESAAEAAFVHDYCRSIGVPHVTLPWAHDAMDGNIPAKARDARYRLMAEWCVANDIGHVLLGHTQDDQAENFIMRLARKSGPDGLAQMADSFVRHNVCWMRPLLKYSRAALRDYLRRHDVPWVDDPTNEDDQYERARVRKALAVLAPLGVTPPVLQQVSATMRSTRDALDYYVAEAAQAHVVQDHGDLILNMPDLPHEVLRKLWHKMLQWVSQSDYSPRERVIETIFDLKSDSRMNVNGCLISRKNNIWRITREHEVVRDLTGPTDQIWDGRWRLKGPHMPDLQVRTLGEGIIDCPDWRSTGLPRQSLLASPSVWSGDTLIAAPLAGFGPDWTAQIVADFHSSRLTH